jgi:hypothetical protein
MYSPGRHDWHAVAPAKGANFVSEHALHSFDPPAEYVPAGHKRHLVFSPVMADVAEDSSALAVAVLFPASQY